MGCPSLYKWGAHRCTANLEPIGFFSEDEVVICKYEMIPIVLHRRALSNCGHYATSKRESSINLDRMYNNAIAHFNNKVFLPTGWIAWILGAIPVGESKALKVLLVGMETNRRSAAFFPEPHKERIVWQMLKLDVLDHLLQLLIHK